MDADCQAGCEGQANLEAECTPPTVTIEGDVDATFVATLQANFPAILQIAAEGKLAAEAAVDIAASAVKIAGNATASCAAAVAAVAAQLEAAANASASVSASVSVSADVSGSASAGG
jgi:hypothetical protein